MAHVPVIRRSMRPDEWTQIRLRWLSRRIISESYEIDGWQIRHAVQTGEMTYRMEDEAPRPLHKGDVYFTPDGTAFLSVKAILPESLRGRNDVRLKLSTAAEMIVKVNGEFAGGIDPNRETMPLPESTDGIYFIEIEGYNRSKPDDDRNMETSQLKGCRQIFTGAQFVVFDEEIRALYYDVFIFFDMLQGGQFDDDLCALISDRLYKALNLIDWEANTGYGEAREYIRRELYQNKLYPGAGDVALVAHSHLDIAYYWRRVHSVQKNARTCLIQTELMDRYPKLIYTHTQAYLFESLEKNYPKIFERVREKIQSGQFEIVGGMYVESDCNVPSAESLTRQFLYGQLYFRENFGITCRNCWLPDVFGNSAVLPQILKKSGIDYFVSNKMSTWNDTNRFPHNNFIWKGLDGSSVYACVPPTHFITAATPTEIVANWAAFQDKDSGQTLCMYGYGDGGSGVTEDMMEYANRLNQISGMPNTEITGGQAYLDKNFANSEKLAVWDGELYLEMHRGTFTTKSDLKKQNRRMETLLRETEMACALRSLNGAEYPHAELTRLWKLLLVNQFHDILPGSHIHPVYDDAMADYREIEACAERLLNESGDEYYNSLGFDRTGAHFLPNPEGADMHNGVRGSYRTVAMPALKSMPLSASEFINTDWLDYSFDSNGILKVNNAGLTMSIKPDGSFASLSDASGREYTDGAFNELRLFRDILGNYDAWDILPTYREKQLPITVETPLHFENEFAETAVFSATLKTDKSIWIRRIRVFRNDAQIEVENHVDWHETHVLAKVEFNCAVRTPYAFTDTGAGYIARETNRNTSWQQARYEVCQHKWADLSEADGGIAIINDSKYGVGLWENVISLSLLRAPCRPDPIADRGVHDFSYRIVPHTGTAVDAGINRLALMFNTPIRRLSLPELHLPPLGSLHLQAVKRAEDGKGLVIRLTEQDAKRGKLIFETPVTVTNILEDAETVTQTISYKPFEMLTLRLPL